MNISTLPLICLSPCQCGFNLLADDIPLGTMYSVVTETAQTFTYMCGGCGRVHHRLAAVLVNSRQHPNSFLPLPRMMFIAEEE